MSHMVRRGAPPPIPLRDAVRVCVWLLHPVPEEVTQRFALVTVCPQRSTRIAGRALPPSPIHVDAFPKYGRVCHGDHLRRAVAVRRAGAGVLGLHADHLRRAVAVRRAGAGVRRPTVLDNDFGKYQKFIV